METSWTRWAESHPSCLSLEHCLFVLLRGEKGMAVSWWRGKGRTRERQQNRNKDTGRREKKETSLRKKAKRVFMLLFWNEGEEVLHFKDCTEQTSRWSRTVNNQKKPHSFPPNPHMLHDADHISVLLHISANLTYECVKRWIRTGVRDKCGQMVLKTSQEEIPRCFEGEWGDLAKVF